MKDHDLVNDTDLQLSTYFFFFLNCDTDVAIFKNCKIKLPLCQKKKRLVEVKKYGGNAVSDNLIPLP